MAHIYTKIKQKLEETIYEELKKKPQNWYENLEEGLETSKIH